MPVTVKNISLWRKEVENQVGAMAQTLEPVTKAGANLQVLMGYRYPGEETKSAIEVYPIATKKMTAAASEAGLSASSIPTLLVEGDDRPGLGFAIAQAIAGVGINMTFFVAQAIGRRFSAVHRVTRIGSHQVEYLAKDTRNKQFVSKRYTNEEFVETLIQHVPDRGRHAMRYFGLLSPRSKAQLWAGIFVLLNQRKRQHPPRLSWRWLRLKTFGSDPLQDSLGQPMHWIGRRAPLQMA